MAIRIKTISNEIIGANKPERRGAHKPNKDESGQSSKILELEWEALGRKLNKHTGNELEKLRRQLGEKDEMLQQANQKIAVLKKQLNSLQEKQRMHRPQPVNHNRFKLPVRGRK